MSRVSEGLRNRTCPIIFAAPSGAGKTTIANRLMETRDDVAFSVSMTTRPPRGYEREAEHYFFVSEPEFRRRVAAGELLEWAEVHGNLYGTPRRNLDAAVERGQYLLLDIDIQGARQVRSSVSDAISIFVLPPSGTGLTERLLGRGSEDRGVQRRRLGNALAEIRAASEFDYVIVNDSLEESVRLVEAILRSEACRTTRLPGLGRVLIDLDSEIRAELGRISDSNHDTHSHEDHG